MTIRERHRKYTEAAGWYGVAAILSAYVGSNFGLISTSALAYTLLNLSGALALIADSWPDRNWQVIALNAVWASVAIIAVVH